MPSQSKKAGVSEPARKSRQAVRAEAFAPANTMPRATVATRPTDIPRLRYRKGADEPRGGESVPRC